MSFFMTLPSNVISHHHNNKQSNYTTQLSSPLSFSVPYEVALVEFSYRQFISFNIGSLHIKLDGDTKFRIYQINIYDNEPLEHFVERFNFEINDYFSKLAFLVAKNKVDAYIDHSDNIRKFDEQPGVDQYVKTNTLVLPKLTIKKDTNNTVTLVIPHKVVVKFVGDYCIKLFGVTDKEIGESSREIVILSEHLNFIDYLMIYCDIVEQQYVGDAYAPLLRTICLTGEFNKTTEKVYTAPHYLPVSKSFICSINIDVRDPSGAEARFESLLSKVLVKLHFRPIQYV